MTYTQIGYGSSGSDVKKLQQLLNDNGYNLSVDGVYGDKTQAAVKAYQQANGLTVDGIAGDNTWNSLTGFKPGANATTMGTSTNTKTTSGSTGTSAKAASTTSNTSGGFQYGEYQASDAVKQAEALLQQQMANKPGEYQSPYADQIGALIDQIMNREAFSYDLNSDALYQQYADQYTQLGKMAMMDTMGQAAAMTGGYGNSYAQSVGQQAYQAQLQNLNDVVPQLYQMALDQYNQQGQEMYNQYGLLASQDEQEYGKYRDSVSDYMALLQAAYEQYNAERDYDYGVWADGRDFAYGQYSDDRAYAYQQERDKVADEQWQKEYDEMVRQFNKQYALSASKSSGGSSGGSGGSSGSGSKKSSGGSGYDTHGYTKDQIKALQRAAGITADGIWGPQTQKAYEAGYRPDSKGNNNTGGGVPTNYSEMVQYLKSVASSSSKSEISADIRSAVNAGIITENQAQKLLSTFAK